MNENFINQQTGQSVGGVYGGKQEPEKDDTPTDKPLTLDDVQTAIVAMVQPLIDKLTEAIKGGFATKNDLDSFVNRLSNNIESVKSEIPNHNKIVETAREAVPVCLRNLDTAGTPRTGNVMMLAPAPAGTSGNADSCYFGEVKAGGLSALGTKVLYEVVALREYIKADPSADPPVVETLVDVGSETGGSDRTLEPTWDWLRFVTTSAPG